MSVIRVPFGSGVITRVEPQMASTAYKTYAISRQPDRPIKTACEQVGCEAWLHGWETHLDESTEAGADAARYVRTQAGRTFTERYDGAITVFRFESRQRCFANHLTIAERFTVLGGDFRRYTGVQRVHANGRDWAEDFSEHQQQLHDQIEKG